MVNILDVKEACISANDLKKARGIVQSYVNTDRALRNITGLYMVWKRGSRPKRPLLNFNRHFTWKNRTPLYPAYK